MKCPVDGTPLAMTELKSQVVDYCPKCRGMWLTRESLNKLLEKPDKVPEGLAKKTEPEEKPKTIVDDFLEGFGLK